MKITFTISNRMMRKLAYALEQRIRIDETRVALKRTQARFIRSQAARKGWAKRKRALRRRRK